MDPLNPQLWCEEMLAAAIGELRREFPNLAVEEFRDVVAGAAGSVAPGEGGVKLLETARQLLRTRLDARRDRSLGRQGRDAGPAGGGDFFQELADGAPVMIWMSGLDMGCFYFNRAWLDFRGRTLEQESGNGWAEGVHPEDLQRCVSHYVSCFERRIAFAMTYRLLSAAGEFRWILDRGVPHYLPGGTFLGFFGGCAEIEEATPIVRSAELGPAIAAMREFARSIAEPEASAAGSSDATRQELEAFARRAHDEHAERVLLRKHAATELTQLATDMVKYGWVRPGVCLP